MTQDQTIFDRLFLTFTGLILGLALFFMFDSGARGQITLSVALWIGSSAVFLMLLYKFLNLGKTLSLALGLGALVGLLFYLQSFRFIADGDTQSLTDLMDPFTFFALLAIGFIPLPFLINQAQSAASPWVYEGLKTQAWYIFFAGLATGLYHLCNLLLSFVGITLLEEIWEIELFAYCFFAGFLGLAVSTLSDLDKVIVTIERLIVLLLRLLLVPLALVALIFTLFVPLQIEGETFSDLSLAVIVGSVAITLVILINATVDGKDATASQSSIMPYNTRLAALLLLPLGCIMAYSIYLRIDQYGFSPERLAALLVNLVILGYALAYFISACLKQERHWFVLRQANVFLAGFLFFLGLLALTPLLNPYKISANSQYARFMDGRTPVDGLTLYQFDKEWGRAGKELITKLEAIESHEELALLKERLANRPFTYRYAGDNKRNRENRERRAFLQENLKVISPSQQTLSDDSLTMLIGSLDSYKLARVQESCELKTDAGNPVCGVVLADFNPNQVSLEALIFHSRKGSHDLWFYLMKQTETNQWEEEQNKKHSLGNNERFRLVDQIHAGQISLVPSNLMFMRVNEITINPFYQPQN